MRPTVIPLALLVLLLLAGAALADGAPVVDRCVSGSGGGYVEVSPYILQGTLGQAVVGLDSYDPYQLCSGFWCRAVYKVYLPLVLRVSS